MSNIVPKKNPPKSEDPLAAQRSVRPRARRVDPVLPEKSSGPEEKVGNYGRGIYAGHSTFGLDFTTQGSYGRGIYVGHSTLGLDFATQGSFAASMERGGQ